MNKLAVNIIIIIIFFNLNRNYYKYNNFSSIYNCFKYFFIKSNFIII